MKKKTRMLLRDEMRYLFFLIPIFIVIDSCSTAEVLKLYPEQSLLPSEPARLYGFTEEGRANTSQDCFLTLIIKEFDGNRLDDSFDILEILPGLHTMKVAFKPFDRWGSTWFPQSYLTIHFNAMEGGEYVFGCHFDLSGEWSAWVIDRYTGEIVGY
jgi:hypothetical protein